VGSIVVIYHSGYGHTKVLADAVGAGAAESPDLQVRVFSVEEVEQNWEILDCADALIFGSPTYMGSVSAPFKQFMDQSGQRWLKQAWKGKLAAGFTNSGSLNGDKQNVLNTLWVFSQQHSMVWIPLNLATTGTSPEDLNRLSISSGASAVSANAPADQTPPSGDRETARHLGREVARWVRIVREGKAAIS
jgi:NAD(P)H dehydrogenase (quinone)